MNTDYPLLSVKNLSKTFRSQWTFRKIVAIRDINFELAAGETVGFLGHNGAGKTSTLKCILSLLSPSTGEILFQGEKAEQRKFHSQIGFLPELPYFYEHLTVFETLDFFAALHGLKARRKVVLETLERVGLIERLKSPVQSLSKGLQQRLAFAQAIVNSPKLLLLDEPFSGLDPFGRQEMRDLILEFKRKGTSILLSSHILPDVESICERVIILAKGRIKAQFRLEEMSSLFGSSYELILRGKRSELNQGLTRASIRHEVQSLNSEQYKHQLHFQHYAEALKAIAALGDAEAELINFQHQTPSLEEIFLKLSQNPSNIESAQEIPQT